jgi:hypothetical protein
MNILEAIDDPNLFGPWFRDPETWQAWRAFLAALFALPMTGEQFAVYQSCTGRAAPPAMPPREAWLICGRRAGKSFTLALCAVYLACFKHYARYLQAGEVATIRIMAADRDQTRVIMRYVGAMMREIPMLKALLVAETAEGFQLSNRVSIECGTASFRASRGYTYAAVLADEVAFWRSDESANPDTEILRACRPGLLTIPTSVMLCASSPYARKGELWMAHRRWYGRDDAPSLVWRAPTRVMNPTVPQSDIDQEMERDPASASAEYMAEFRTDVESFMTLEAVRACIAPDVRERPPQRQWRYWGFVDPSGGRSDSMTLAIAHKEGATCILDLICEVRPPFSPEAVCEEFAELAKQYRLTTITGDRYAGEWPREQFRKHSINYEPSQKTKSECYLDVAPLINSRAVDLLDITTLVNQLIGLERRTARGGRDSIDHAPASHDDVANAAAGALVLASVQPTGWTRSRRMPGGLSSGRTEGPRDPAGWMAN